MILELCNKSHHKLFYLVCEHRPRAWTVDAFYPEVAESALPVVVAQATTSKKLTDKLAETLTTGPVPSLYTQAAWKRFSSEP